MRDLAISPDELTGSHLQLRRERVQGKLPFRTLATKFGVFGSNAPSEQSWETQEAS
jgi:hypothetical protein